MTAVRNKIHTNQRGRNETKLLENIKPSPSSLQHVILREKYDSAENYIQYVNTHLPVSSGSF